MPRDGGTVDILVSAFGVGDPPLCGMACDTDVRGRKDHQVYVYQGSWVLGHDSSINYQDCLLRLLFIPERG